MEQQKNEISLNPIPPINIKFANLTVAVNGDDDQQQQKVILNDATGYFKAGSVTGILGGSGAGKYVVMIIIMSSLNIHFILYILITELLSLMPYLDEYLFRLALFL